MSNAFAGLAFVAVVSLMSEAAVLGQPTVLNAPDGGAAPPLLTTNPTFRASIERIAARSPLWRQAVDGLRNTGRHAVILTPDQVVVTDEPGGPETVFDPLLPAETAPVPLPGSAVTTVLVVVNLPLIESVHRRRNSLPAEFETDVDRILIHEIYGHALPLLATGNLSGRCPDPRPGQRASEACSIRRENAVRAEIGAGRRVDYGLEALTLSRRGMQ